MKKEHLEIKNKLLVMQQEIIARAKKDQKDTQVDTSGDEIDLIQGTFLMEMDNQLSQRDLANLRKVEIALEKFDDDTFGICEECEEPIHIKRLQVNPYAELCIGCAEAKELHQHI